MGEHLVNYRALYKKRIRCDIEWASLCAIDVGLPNPHLHHPATLNPSFPQLLALSSHPSLGIALGELPRRSHSLHVCSQNTVTGLVGRWGGGYKHWNSLPTLRTILRAHPSCRPFLLGLAESFVMIVL